MAAPAHADVTECEPILYSSKYVDAAFEYRHVTLPPPVTHLVNRARLQDTVDLMAEHEWRSIGVQQSRGWQHYGCHPPEPHVLLFRRPLPPSGDVDMDDDDDDDDDVDDGRDYNGVARNPDAFDAALVDDDASTVMATAATTKWQPPPSARRLCRQLADVDVAVRRFDGIDHGNTNNNDVEAC
jgi:cyclin-dependent kinase regulatory subunit CKS1